ncbi:aldehyde dehydrogenase family protein [Cupriavidus oxalaticus]|uniref:aldehyde dehydrogenase family protein n=1 Tax=Cupriavidus oxalaticus TaxID=96344 RepID=UPI002688E692
MASKAAYASVRSTIFINVSNDAAIAREEIFGTVLAVIPYDSEEDAIRIANDSEHGLAADVRSGDLVPARRVVKRLRAGTASWRTSARRLVATSDRAMAASWASTA